MALAATRGSQFLADAMLGSLARKLRALGFDTEYYRSGDDAGMIELASDSGRVILTSDRSLASRANAKGVAAILVTGGSDGARIGAAARGAVHLRTPMVRGDPLCSVCNGRLQKVAKKEILGQVPPSVSARHRLFFRCMSCGHIYWRGSHWKKLMGLARQLGGT